MILRSLSPKADSETTFRGEKSVMRAEETIQIPANAPHFFTNTSERAARLLCVCALAGQDELFALVGVPLMNRRAPPP
jgi:quercetin dioxygenase-like cupin family protein